jgi:chromosome segregation ATPase
MKGWEIVITDIQFYVGLVSILGFGWSVFKFILNARLAPLERQVEQNKDEINRLNQEHSRFREDYNEIKLSMKSMSQDISHILDGLDKLNTALVPMQAKLQANSDEIIRLQGESKQHEKDIVSLRH